MTKTPFDIVKNLNSSKWDEDMAVSWNTYMVLRILSMNPDNLELIDLIQRFTNIPDKSLYELFRTSLPSNSSYPVFVKSQSTVSKDLKSISKFFGVGKREARDYLKILSKDRIEEIRNADPDEEFTLKKKSNGRSKRNAEKM